MDLLPVTFPANKSFLKAEPHMLVTRQIDQYFMQAGMIPARPEIYLGKGLRLLVFGSVVES